jgi:acetyltransferase
VKIATMVQAAVGALDLAWTAPGRPGSDSRLERLQPLQAPPSGGRIGLADGRCARLRPVQPTDLQAEEAFVAALSPKSRRLRFHGAVKQLPLEALRALTAIDQRRHVAWVAEAGCADGARRLVADARYIVDEWPAVHPEAATGPGRSAEFALAVADDWQGVGLGKAMLQRLMRHARSHGLALLRGTVLVENAPMLALVARLGARVRSDHADASVVQVHLAP